MHVVKNAMIIMMIPPITAAALTFTANIDHHPLRDTTPCRRTWVRQALRSSMTGAATLLLATTAHPLSACGATTASVVGRNNSSWSSVRMPIQDATDTLEKLLLNWQRATIDCTYADVPRELLEQKNKELLLEKAATNALFDKSASVVSCKTVVSTVRQYLGRTGIGPVVELDKSLKIALARLLEEDTMEMEQIETIVQTVEDAQRELTRADSLSYSARRDFSSMNNFDPTLSSKILADSGSNLQQCKAAIQTAVDKLRIVLRTLPID
jgi:hypothetical protein